MNLKDRLMIRLAVYTDLLNEQIIELEEQKINQVNNLLDQYAREEVTKRFIERFKAKKETIEEVLKLMGEEIC